MNTRTHTHTLFHSDSFRVVLSFLLHAMDLSNRFLQRKITPNVHFFPIRPKTSGFAKIFFKKFREVFASFSQVFASFLKFSELLGPAWTCSDAFGWVWTRLDAFESVRTHLKNFGKVDRKICYNGSLFLPYCLYCNVLQCPVMSCNVL